jgi:hypothetical protein
LMMTMASALKMETARFSETSASTNQSTRRFNPKEHNQKLDSATHANCDVCRFNDPLCFKYQIPRLICIHVAGVACCLSPGAVRYICKTDCLHILQYFTVHVQWGSAEALNF